jgi:hypothetical protein
VERFATAEQQILDQDTVQTALDGAVPEIATSEIATYQTTRDVEIAAPEGAARYQAGPEQQKAERAVREQAERELLAREEVEQERIIGKQVEQEEPRSVEKNQADALQLSKLFNTPCPLHITIS